jgi:hypothetical protein
MKSILPKEHGQLVKKMAIDDKETPEGKLVRWTTAIVYCLWEVGAFAASILGWVLWAMK